MYFLIITFPPNFYYIQHQPLIILYQNIANSSTFFRNIKHIIHKKFTYTQNRKFIK